MKRLLCVREHYNEGNKLFNEHFSRIVTLLRAIVTCTVAIKRNLSCYVCSGAISSMLSTPPETQKSVYANVTRYIRPLFLRYASQLFEAIRERSGQKLSAAKRFYRDYILFIRIPICANSSINRQTIDVLRFLININRIREKSEAEGLKVH